MCCSMTQLSVNFLRSSASATGRTLRGHGCGNCCPGSGFFGPQSGGATVAAVRLVRYHSLRPRAHPFTQHGWSPLRASSGRDVCVPPTAGARLRRQHNTPGHAFHQLCRWEREFYSSFFDRCTLHTAQSTVRLCKQQPASGPQRQFVCLAVRVCFSGESAKPHGCCRSPSCQTHASRPPARRECHLRAHQPHVPTYRARSSARVRSTRPSLPVQL